MFNDVLWILYVLLDLGMAVVMFRLFGKKGLFATIVVAAVLSNIQVVKLVDIFGFTNAIGNVTYASIFFATDMLSEIYGKKEARKGVWLGFASIIIMAVYMQLLLLFKPSQFDIMQPHLKAIFSLTPRIALGSVIAYLISQNIDVTLFHFWKKLTKGRFLWLRNNGSTMISQFVDSVVFITIAFWGVFPIHVFVSILLSCYFLKWLIAAIDTGFIYWGRSWAIKMGLNPQKE